MNEDRKMYENGVNIIRGDLNGVFRLLYIPTGEIEDGHAGKRRKVRQACLAWGICRNGKVVDSGYKFNPFSLDDAVELVFSSVEKISGA